MKKIRCLLPLLLLALFTGCTLMIDEPETATTPQETENGDGITSPRRIVSDMGEVRYQIGPETRMIDKDYLPYLLTYKTDTLDRVTEIYFNKSIPLELLPQRGEFLATDQTDAIPNGLAHQVNLVRTTDNGYTVEVSPASYDDVYKTLDIVTDFDIVRVPVEQSNAYGFWKVAGDEPEYEYKLRGTYLNPLARYAPLRADDPIDKRWSIADLGFKLSKGHYTKLFSKYMLGDSAWDWEPSSGKASYNFHLDGDFDAYAGLEIFWHFHSDIRKDDGYADVATSIEYELKAGFGGERAEIGVTFPIMGNKSWNTKDWKQKYKEASGTNPFKKICQIDKSDYWVQFNFPEANFTIGPVPCSVGVDFACTADLYGYLQMQQPFIFETGIKGTILKTGFHIDPDSSYSYPKQGDPLDKLAEPYIITQGAKGLPTLGLGLRPNVNAALTFTAGELIKASIGPTISCPIEFGRDFSRPSELTNRFPWEPKDYKGDELGYAANSGLTFDPTVSIEADVTLDLKVWEFPLAHTSLGEWKIPIGFFKRWNPKLKVDKIYPLPDKSNADSTCYYATINTEKETFFSTPEGLPELYVYKQYDDQGKRATCISHDSEKYDPKATYEYEFYLPKSSRDIFCYATPVLDGKYHYPEKFTRFGKTLEIKNIERVQVTGTGDVLSEWEEAVGVKLNLNGKIMDQCSSLELVARIEAEEGGFLPTQTFYLDVPQFGKEYVKNLLFVIAYTNVRPANVSFSLRYYDAELKEHLLDYKTFEFSDYDFSGDDLDLDNMKKWTKKGYELLQ